MRTTESVTGRAVRGFARTCGRDPDVAWSAPGRVNLIGEHTDYNEGFVLPFAITQRTVAAAARRGDDVITLTSTHQPGTENARVSATVAALEADDMEAVGRYLTASHRSMRDDFEITTPTLDLTVETALAAGALGSRMTGGGFGGSTISLIDAERVSVLAAAITEAFGRAGLATPRISQVTPGPGAHREAR